MCALAFCKNLEDTKERKGDGDLIPLVFTVLQQCLPVELEQATEILEQLVELQDTNEFLQETGHMATIAQSMLALSRNPDIENSCRCFAVLRSAQITWLKCAFSHTKTSQTSALMAQVRLLAQAR